MKMNLRITTWGTITLVATGVLVLAAVSTGRGSNFRPVPLGEYFRDLVLPLVAVALCAGKAGGAILDAISASGRSVGEKAIASVVASWVFWIIISVVAAIIGAVFHG